MFLGLFGAAAILIASLHIVLGPSAIPGAIPVNSTMDSEDRFYATLFAAYGVALLWCIGDIERKSKYVYFLAATFLAGGLARVVSILAVGPPNAFFLAMTALELLIPPFMVFTSRATENGCTGSVPSRVSYARRGPVLMLRSGVLLPFATWEQS